MDLATRYGWTDAAGVRHYCMEDVRRANGDGGSHFFERDAMRFFGSRLLHPVYNGPGGSFFVTSERRPRSNDARRYTVRRFVPETGSVETVGTFQQYATGTGAKNAARRYAAHGIPEAVKALPPVRS